MGELELAWARNEADQIAAYEEADSIHDYNWREQYSQVEAWLNACHGSDCNAHVSLYSIEVLGDIPF